MTIEAIDDNVTVSLPRASMYGIDGIGWRQDSSTIYLKKGQMLSVKDNIDSVYGNIVIQGKCNLRGNCMSLVYGDNANEATMLKEKIFKFLFAYNTGIQSIDKAFLPATTLAERCYEAMFLNCSGLTQAPELPATNLAKSCYYYMFRNCTNLKYIKMLATDISADYCLDDWVKNVASTGTFVANKNATWDTTPGALDTSGVPAGWTVVNDGENGGGGEITFPITLIEGDNGTTGVKFFNYVKGSKYTNEEVYIIHNGYKIQTFEWGPTLEGSVASYSWEVVDATNGVGRPTLVMVELNENGILTIVI